MLGAAVVGLVVITPLMLVSGQTIVPLWPVPAAQMALVASSIIHVVVYASYVWLVGRAGAVFAVQVSYMVTGFGLFWAWLILNEAFSLLIFVALAAMFAGMYLVQPRPKAVLAAHDTIDDT
jgi:drug/metabolite transporter (DMT)-like permease